MSEAVTKQNLLEPAGFKMLFCDCMAVSVHEEAFNSEMDKAVATALEAIPGRYWLRGLGFFTYPPVDRPTQQTGVHKRSIVSARPSGLSACRSVSTQSP